MLKKLLKYDSKAIARLHLPIYAILLALAVFVRIFIFLGEKFPVLNVIEGLSIFTFCVLLFGSIFGTFILSTVYFYHNMLKDEGYLTHTLPVKKSSLIASKTIVAFVFSTITVVIAMLAALLAFYQPGFFGTVKELLQQLQTLYDIPVWFLIISTIITYLFGNLCQILLMYLSLALGQLYTGKKLIYSIVYMILIYTGIQIITSVALFGTLTVIPGLWDQMEAEVPDLLFIGVTYGISNVVSILLSILFYYATTYLFTKKLNME